MGSDRTLEPASAAGGAYRDYLRYTRPYVARQMRALGLDIEYSAGQGDTLRLSQPSPISTDVLDLVGGYGISLFGHNHPDLVAVAQECLKERKPFSAQASVRSSSARLAARMSACVGESTGARYVVTFGSTGADAVEAAIKHASMARSRRLAEVQARLERDLRRARRDGFARMTVSEDSAAGGRRSRRPVERVLVASIAKVAAMRRCRPVFVSLEGAFHGKTAGAYSITDHADVPDDLVVSGPKRLRLGRDDWIADKIVAAFDSELVTVCGVEPDAAGVPRPTQYHLSPIAACFAEPIQGEGGVREVPDDVLRALRELADRHRAALVFDEIQCGMGRTGSFLASAKSGVRADYYLFSKSLGGGLAKISALLVQADLANDDFGGHHTSTFAEDDFSAEIALGAIDLLTRVQPLIVAAGQKLGSGLEAVAARWPDVFKEVRGRALLRGIELAQVHDASKLVASMLAPERIGYVVAGHLLHEHGIRVMPTLSAPTTLRIQPSAYLSDSDIDRLVSALDATAALLHNRDFATLMRHLSLRADPAWLPPRAATPRRRTAISTSESADPTIRVAFLANLKSAGDLRALAPELNTWSDRQFANMLDRVLGEWHPVEVAREPVVSPTGRRVEVAVCNIRERDQVEALAAFAAERFGGQVDVLVNNAGIMDHMEGVANFRDDTFERVFGVNVYGPFVTSRAAVNHMKQRGAGAIVNVASVAGVTGAAAGAVYTASKHALVGLSRNTAYAYAPFGIRCNTLIVGGVETNIMAAADPTKFDAEALAQYGKWHAANPRTLKPDEVAALSLFLASDEASGISGAEVAVDAGWTAAG